VLIPLQSEYYALEGLGQLLATIDLVRDNLNPALTVDGIVLTMYDARTRLSADVADEVRRHLGASVYQTIIPRSVRLSEAPSYGQAIATYSPESRGARAYRALADEFLDRRSANGAKASPAEPAESTPSGAGAVAGGAATHGSPASVSISSTPGSIPSVEAVA